MPICFAFFSPGDQNALRNILLYHLIQGVFIANGIEPGVTSILKTIQGGKLYLKMVSSYSSFLKRPLPLFIVIH